MSLRVVLALGIALFCVQTTLGQRWPVPYGSVDTLTDHSSNPEKDGFKHVRHSIGFDFILKDDTSGKCPLGFHVDKNYFNGDTVKLQQFRDSFKQSQMPSIVWFGEEYHKNGKRMRSLYTLSPHPCHSIPGFSEVSYPLQTPCHVKLTMACARPTGRLAEYPTAFGFNILKHADGGKKYTYVDAMNKCQQSVGFTLPTFQELKQLEEAKGFWNQPYRDVVLAGTSSGLWIRFKYGYFGINKKRFICVGCRPEFMRSYGIESITSDGVVTCMGGFKNVKTSNQQPTCNNGHWKNIDACEYFLIKREWKGSPRVHYFDIYGAAFEEYVNQVAHHRPTYRTDLEKETALRGLARKNGKLNGFSTFGTKLIVQTTRDPPYQASTSVPLKGLFTCTPGYVWRCPRKERDCSRSGRTYIPVIHSERNVHRNPWQSYSYTNYWLNTPYCTKTVVNFPPQFSPLYLRNRVFLNKETASFRCQFHYYEVCHRPGGDCAGGKDNVAARYEMQPDGTAVWSNLPNCEPFVLKPCSYGKVKFLAHFGNATTFVQAKYACERIGYILTPVELYDTRSPLTCRNFNWRIRANWQSDGLRFLGNEFMCIPQHYKGYSYHYYQYSELRCGAKKQMYYHLWRPQNGAGRTHTQAAAACSEIGSALPTFHDAPCVTHLLATNVRNKISNQHDFAWMSDLWIRNQHGSAYFALNYKHLSSYYSNTQLRTTICVQRS